MRTVAQIKEKIAHRITRIEMAKYFMFSQLNEGVS
jgi:hypothetical protein